MEVMRLTGLNGAETDVPSETGSLYPKLAGGSLPKLRLASTII
ncbi:MAG: hypothetical protein OXP66_11545 [Candidatus Tectomicrobia bacterium]|nr:hypothetical protein [Candidatus Tectomicrobia bacterium]